MRFMVIEHYAHGPEPVYERAAARGRMLPSGLHYLDSWVVDDGRLDTCFQLMETDDPGLFDVWLDNWRDLGRFEVVPVVDSAEASRRVAVTWAGGTGPEPDEPAGPIGAAAPAAPAAPTAAWPDGWRRPTVDDAARIRSVIDGWWGGRDLTALVQRQLFEHFSSTSLVVDDSVGLAAFLVAFDSADHADCTYVHLVGVRPDLRASGLGRRLYEAAFAEAAVRGRSRMRCVTGLVNRPSIGFHRSMGFDLVRGDAELDGIPYHRDHGGPGVDQVVFERRL